MTATDISALAGRIRTMGELTDAERSALLGLLCHARPCGLVWEEKGEEVEERLRTGFPTLKEVGGRAVVSDDADAANHTIIEGDNLVALEALAITHSEAIDIIYIDPPYNTGNRELSYNDTRVASGDSYRHSEWLSFMNRRLLAARRLMSDRGVIFISIDDRMHGLLKLLSDQIFGEDNYITTFVWEKTQHFGRQKLNYYSNSEYILCYARQLRKDGVLRRLLVEQSGTRPGDAPLFNASNKPAVITFPAGSVRFDINDGIYHQSRSRHYLLMEPVEIKKGTNVNPLVLTFRSRWSQSMVDDQYRKGTTFLVKTAKFAIRAVYHQFKISRRAPKSIIFTNINNPLCAHTAGGLKVGITENGSKELSDILPGCRFPYPKPTSLINYLLSLSEGTTVLDFFAGSGTTLHAVMQLNATDGRRRRCILCNNDENGICRNITYERNKRVIKGYTDSDGRHVAGLTGNNLRYYTAAPEEPDAIPASRFNEIATGMLCIMENIYEDTSDKPSLRPDTFPEHREMYRCFTSGHRTMIVVNDLRCLDMISELISAVPSTVDTIKLYIIPPHNALLSRRLTRQDSRVKLGSVPAALLNACRHPASR